MDYSTIGIILIIAVLAFFVIIAAMSLYYQHQAQELDIMKSCKHLVKTTSSELQCNPPPP